MFNTSQKRLKAIKINFLDVNGKMIIQHTIDSAKKIKKYCDIVISSELKKNYRNL